MAHLLEANGPHLKSKSLMRFSVIYRVEVYKRQLPEFLSPYFEYRFGFCLLCLTSIQKYVWFVILRRKLLIIVTLQFYSFVVVSWLWVKPSCGIYAGVGEILICFAAHKSEESQLDGAKRVIADAEPPSQCWIPKWSFILPESLLICLTYHPSVLFLQGMFGILLAWTSGETHVSPPADMLQ